MQSCIDVLLNFTEKKVDVYSLEKVSVVLVPEERYSVGEHPDVSTATIIIRLAPFPVLILDGQDVIRHPLPVSCVVIGICVETCNKS